MRTVALGEIATQVDYGVTASASRNPIGPKFLRITDIRDGRVDWESVPFCQCDARQRDAARLTPGDIVFARTGSVGNSFLIRDCPEDAVFASYLIRVRLDRARVDRQYVAHFFNTPDYWAQIARGARGAIQPGVNASVLKELRIPLPPIEEQRRIAAILNKADKLRAKRRAALAHLDSLTQSIFLDMFGDRTDGERERLSEICDIQVGFPFKSDTYEDGGVRLCRGTNVLPDRFDWSDLAYVGPQQALASAGFALAEGDVVVAMDRPWISEGFKSARVTRSEAGALLVQRVARIRPAPTVLPSHYLYAAVRFGEFQRHCKPTETTVPHISPVEIRSYLIPVPARALLETFEIRAQRIVDLRKTLRDAADESTRLFGALQDLAFSGEL